MRVFFTRFFALSLLLATSQSLFANDEKWTLEKEKDGIKIYSRHVEGWTIREIRAIAEMPASINSIFAVLNDPETSATELSDIVKKSTITHRSTETHYQVYSEMDMPWPLDDRDVLNDRKLELDQASGVITITDTAAPEGMPKQKGLVRIEKSHQIWTLTPTSPRSTHVQFQVLVDPNGPIPAAIINKMSIGQPINTFTNLVKLANTPDYQRAPSPVALLETSVGLE